ncbi:MAG: hypothetical protein L6Q57_08170 [Alphaproteobacteria bacterium]|nr:hypothetical protein [Alphaproteobacteria bacterium]
MSFLGDILGSALGFFSAKDTNRANQRAADDTNQFTREMMQNRHQWEVNDLKAAGLNPVLSAGGTPSMGSSAKADVINPMDSISQGLQSALAVKRFNFELDNLKADTEKKKQEAYLTSDLSQKAAADTSLAIAQIRNAETQNDLLKYQLPGARVDAKTDKSTIGGWARAVGRTVNNLLPMFNSAKSLAR